MAIDKQIVRRKEEIIREAMDTCNEHGLGLVDSTLVVIAAMIEPIIDIRDVLIKISEALPCKKEGL